MKTYRSAVLTGDFHPGTAAYFDGRTVVVTGGGGFIGSHAVEQLVTLGASVVVPCRSRSHYLDHLQDVVTFVDCDLTQLDAVTNAVNGAACIVHLAADVGGLSYNAEHPASTFDRNLRIGLNVLEAARITRVPRVAVCSSACVYPRVCPVPTPESEGHVGEPEPTNKGYGWAKRMLEKQAQFCADEYGLEIAIPRPYNAYGPRDMFDESRSHVIPALIKKAIAADHGMFEVWGDGTATRSFVYVDDFARGVLETTARYPVADPINIGTDEEVSIGDLAQIVAASVGRATGQTAQPTFNVTAPAGQPRRCCDTSRAREELDFACKISLEEGIDRTVKWYLAA